MHIKTTSKRLYVALMAITLLGACKQSKNAATLRRHGNQKIIAGSIVGATGLGAATTVSVALAAGISKATIALAAASVFLAPVAIIAIPVGIALVTIGATEHRKAKKLAKQERLRALQEVKEPRSWHNQPSEPESIS